MKRISIRDRREVAMTLNFGTYPVLTIDIADRDEYGLVGCKVRILDGTSGYIRAQIRVFRDEQYVTTHSNGCCLHADWGYSDVKEMLDWASAPEIECGQDVALVVYDSKRQCAYDIYILKVGDHLSRHCMTPVSFEKLYLSEFFKDEAGA